MTTQAQQRDSHPYYMHDAVLGQPDAIAQVLDAEKNAVSELVEIVTAGERVHVVGIGTSWHAALVGEYLLRIVGGREDARAWNSFEFCAYPPKLGACDTVIVMSHRGTKRYSAQALQMAKESGARTAVVTGIGSDARADLADVVLHTCSPELSSAFTVSHTAAMTVLAMLSIGIGSSVDRSVARDLRPDLARLPELMSAALGLEDDVRRWAQRASSAFRYYFAGWGPNASTAYEVALKMQESSYVATTGFQMEQYLHGPFVATEPGCMVTFIAPPGQGQERVRSLINASNAVGAHTVALVVEGESAISKLVDTTFALPSMPEPLTPIVYLAPLQLFTYWLAVELKRNPDVFRLNDSTHRMARQSYQL